MERPSERAVGFACEGQTLVGVVHLPPTPAALGVVVVVGGPQYRAGSHRQFVQLARALADGGVAVLRFDVRGMGDSDGEPRSFEAIDADIGAAIGALLAAAPGLRRVALWGLCDGASAALLYLDATRDARVAGVCAVNPWVRSDAGLARTHVRHYYARHLLSAAFWRKLLRGGIGAKALAELGRNLALALRPAGRGSAAAPAHFAERMARGCAALPSGGLLLVLSDDDYTAREFDDHARQSPAWRRALQACAATRRDLAGADHTFSQPDARAALEAATLAWLAALCTPQPAPRQRAATAGAAA